MELNFSEIFFPHYSKRNFVNFEGTTVDLLVLNGRVGSEAGPFLFRQVL